jgi:signal transduction histidine kinase
MILIEKGFEVAVRNLVSKLNDTFNCRVNLDMYGLTADMEPYMEHALYVSILEIINNIIKHSGSTEFSIQIIQNNEDITVMIEDNGVGFSPDEANDGKGLGLKSTDSRIKSMNGQFFIDSLPGQGTIVTMIIPLLKTVEA